ncbi:hypothetical protein EV182_000814 [Spiromyces aspiralis]|uniref:Uncharacterized protein n=1 Tax=Spiromyces aspiralis TaxID=68401 RepID=A0ACC1HK94_9FUNG|nr:hypothetical protein EV182_000814 [Spiromyces aspiralis]
MSSYEILCGDVSRLRWVGASGALNTAKDVRLVQAGHEADGTPLYVGKALHHGSQHIGKTGHHLAGVNFGYGGKEVVANDFLVLAYN